MRWSNEMFYILLLNSFAGAIAYGFWMIAKSGMAKRKKLKYVYPMLGIVEAFFIFPIMSLRSHDGFSQPGLLARKSKQYRN